MKVQWYDCYDCHGTMLFLWVWWQDMAGSCNSANQMANIGKNAASFFAAPAFDSQLG